MAVELAGGQELPGSALGRDPVKPVDSGECKEGGI